MTQGHAILKIRQKYSSASYLAQELIARKGSVS